MSKFSWQPDRADRIGIVGGIFAPDGLNTASVEQLVDSFSEQAIDFYSALRSRIYDEQIRDFIHRVGIDQVSRNVVNTTSPPQFQKPNFQLAHPIDVGRAMVAEQQRVQDGSLVREYNQALQEANFDSSPAHPPTAPVNEQFYRAYDNGSQQPALPSGVTPSTPSGPATHRLSPDAVKQVKNLLSQGYGIGIERVDQRRFRTNAWTSCAAFQTADNRGAIAALEQCLNTYPQDYVRLIDINPTNKQRGLWQSPVRLGHGCEPACLWTQYPSDTRCIKQAGQRYRTNHSATATAPTLTLGASTVKFGENLCQRRWPLRIADLPQRVSVRGSI